ncbi:hypothetical protein HFP57_05185 [Parasphingopyxis algicola]|uniref:hypothetical protein n=1 Tax=Parasphingopyxis algicola TaxID=2026624 RepID=UPI00159F8166|nr:hypothetical protein [Parasphingopyxis algicola]QLC24473.1 hypothetical protein HFP57_05185 [Parasphingopyxis algicola]
MRELFIIHATEDVPELLTIANEMGLIIQYDGPNDVPEPILLRNEDFKSFGRGVFLFYKNSWIFGNKEFNLIEDGYYKGKYFQKPSINHVNISIYCSGERKDKEKKYLGSGSISRDVKWYSPKDDTVYAAPDEVKEFFDRFVKAMRVERRLKGGVHKYAVLPHALEKLEEGSARPPFDFIEWP